MQEKSKWSSKIGFILASAGSAIGLGAVWKFPYMTATNGGGIFLLIFLIFTLLVGMPLLIAEFVLGRSGGVTSIRCFGKLSKNKKYNIIGIMGSFSLFILPSFYSVIGGWILAYLGVEIGRILNIINTTNYKEIFATVISNPFIAVGCQGAFIVINILIISRGVKAGIEKASKIMMPLLFIIFTVIICRSLTLPNSFDGVLYFLKPDFSKLTGEGVLYALGQSFFALSVGTTGMLTYGSYLEKDVNIVTSTGSIVGMNIGVSIMAGLAIFPAISSFNMTSEAGPSLLFIVLPKVFNNMPFGGAFYILFLILFLFATITSAISMFEINVANFADEKNTNRFKLSWIIGVIVFVIGIPSALSFGSLSGNLIFGRTFFDNMDFLVSNILMPFGALGISLFSGYVLDKKVACEELWIKTHTFGARVFKVWIFLLRHVLPVIIVIVFLLQLI